jgi:hypothetical protein
MFGEVSLCKVCKAQLLKLNLMFLRKWLVAAGVTM